MEFHRELHLGPTPCPSSIMKIRQEVEMMRPGQTLHVVSTHPSTPKGLKDYAAQVGLTIIHPPQPADDTADHFLVRKPA